MNAARARATAERVARLVIPDLAGRPLYLIQPQDRSVLLPGMLGSWGGMYAPNLLQTFQPELEARGEWKGEGVAVVLDVDQAFAEADEYDAERFAVGTGLHELCHYFDHPEPSCAEQPMTTQSLYGIADESTAATLAPEPTELPIALWGHGASFIRLAAHCWYRANEFGGFCLHPRYLRFGSTYPSLEALSSPTAYINALGDELHDQHHQPLRTIAAMEQPATFAALWNSDLACAFETALAARAA